MGDKDHCFITLDEIFPYIEFNTVQCININGVKRVHQAEIMKRR